ncbi:hypothetical protein BCON_0179g00100 [Botryotinia convoluta]|uniref:Uncharacterized protein n=1 Tax=Botryotinia convoluta TaxID=54673 RepID=A0A4Z1HVT0_9HELO|nr:hypothetical protein BCON_0179g00100 [Botryotinia convoluta]
MKMAIFMNGVKIFVLSVGLRVK